ncbi:hypothetical protein TNIN_373201 [Trichonephila inaurata madagascariensis]|uniref:Uncharacterized protein n=1 Tax=Trichonephila inaurata madagascariensis TaxID=2747483 RepID=A0A8X6Y8L9_9ARAC|nr:hypothetical protein TNIN_373201 [Trichonephila inaurata madagascariensis]
MIMEKDEDFLKLGKKLLNISRKYQKDHPSHPSGETFKIEGKRIYPSLKAKKLGSGCTIAAIFEKFYPNFDRIKIQARCPEDPSKISVIHPPTYKPFGDPFESPLCPHIGVTGKVEMKSKLNFFCHPGFGTPNCLFFRYSSIPDGFP